MADRDALHKFINPTYRAGEETIVKKLLDSVDIAPETLKKIEQRAHTLVSNVRENKEKLSLVNRLMHRYPLSSPQGITLMCLAEALLRIPDASTANALIRDKLSQGDWSQLLTEDESLFTKSSNFALHLTSKMLAGKDVPGWKAVIKRALARSSEPVIRPAMKQVMRHLAGQFILGTTIDEALKRAQPQEQKGYVYSYDMLGEAAMTADDAERYLKAYKHAINACARVSQGKDIYASPGISVKLSALHPRYEYTQRDRVIEELTPKLLSLALKCRESNIALTVDAEECDVLEMSLEIFRILCASPKLAGWEGLGLAVQTYQKRAESTIDWLAELARKHRRKLHVRLVKGAYWDTEIKRAQERGLDQYPVFTQKAYTDLSFMVCAQKLMAQRDIFYPQFGTHNAHTVATILELAGPEPSGFEFQRLHGMGNLLYGNIVGLENGNIPCRIYAPVGSHNDLLPYLVRRLLENGANTSFVHHIADTKIKIEDLIRGPVEKSTQLQGKPHPHIPLPHDLYKPARKNSLSPDLSDDDDVGPIRDAIAQPQAWTSQPMIGGKKQTGALVESYSPFNLQNQIGHVTPATKQHVDQAFILAEQSFAAWSTTPVVERAKCLNKAADLLEQHRNDLIALCVHEGGKTIPDAIDEVREAADFCRYYAQRAQDDFAHPLVLPGPTGEHNEISLHGRGILVGQISAALVAGNAVLAKPAEATPLIASYAIQLFYEAGIPGNVLHFLPGSARQIGAKLIEDSRVSGVAVTGSVKTAHIINRALAQKDGPIVPLIAETGGQNVMIVDSSALHEQVIKDVVTSAFQSAGQRCSALRVLLLQQEIADPCIEMLSGAMAELVVASPERLATDVGPVINKAAQASLEDHIQYLHKHGTLIHQTSLPPDCSMGTFVAPTAFEIESLDLLTQEQFGPILHVIRYHSKDLDKIIDQVNAMGYGLTAGVHSRIDATAQHIHQRLHVGNTYVNRNIIGAVVGVQPFGGEGLSGTGPKAGGPRYLHRFATERTLCIDTTAQGGNAALLTLE